MLQDKGGELDLQYRILSYYPLRWRRFTYLVASPCFVCVRYRLCVVQVVCRHMSRASLLLSSIYAKGYAIVYRWQLIRLLFTLALYVHAHHYT